MSAINIPMKLPFFQLRKPEYRPYGVVLLIGLLLRILWAIAVPVDPVSDSYAYDRFAINVATGQGYGWEPNLATAFWPPGTSFLYAGLYWLFGHHFSAIVILNLILSEIIIGLTMFLANTWFNSRIAIITGLLFAIWPSQIQFTTVLASELPFTALILGVLALWTRSQTQLWKTTGMLGILLAAASYVRPTVFLFPILLFFFRWDDAKARFKHLGSVIAMFLIMGLLIAPWSIRNTQEFGQFVTISTNGGATLWMGNHPGSNGGYTDVPDEASHLNEAERDKYLKAIAIAHIKEQPILFLQRSVSRLIMTHSRESIGIAWNEKGLTQRYGEKVLLPLKLINQAYWISILGCALAGIVLLMTKKGWYRALSHPTVVIWGYFAAIHAIIIAQDRYHFPSNPMIATLAALTINRAIEFRRKLTEMNPSQ